MSDYKMVALKPMKYLTRRLQPGDTFEAKNRRDFAIFQAINKARADDSPPKVSEIDTLKAEYKEKTGRAPHYTWDAETIREKLADS